MNNASMNLVKIISSKNSIDLDELSELIGVGERSLRYKISDCNYYLKHLSFPEIEIVKKHLYFPIPFETVKNKVKENLRFYSFSREEREEIILSFYLFKKESMSIEDISERLQVTSVTLKNDLKRIREKLENFELKLENENSKFLRLIGNEDNTRKLILDFFLRNYAIEFQKDRINIKKEYLNSFFLLWDEMDMFFTEKNVNDSHDLMKVLLEKTEKRISDYDFKRLFFYIIIILKRKEFSKNNELTNTNFLKKTPEFQIIKIAFDKYKLTNFDLFSITKYLLGSRTYEFDNSFYKEWFEIESFVTQLIEEVSKRYEGIKFDEDLVDGLINHIKPAVHRVKNEIKLETPMYEEFKKTYPQILTIVEKAIKTLNNIDLDFPNEEVAYIAMHFYLAIERQKNRIKKNILLVCGSGYSTSRFLEKNISERFSVNIIDVIPYNKLINYESNNEIDLVITTLSNIKSDNHTIINVSPILSEDDIEILTKYGLKRISTKLNLSELIDISKNCSKDFDEQKFIEVMKNKYQNEIIDDVKKMNLLNFLEMIEPERVLKIKYVNTWQDAIKISGSLLVKNDFVNEDYIYEIIELLEKYGNYMTVRDGIFLAHARELKNVYKTGFSFLFLEESIEFPENEKIKLIITLSSKDKKEHLKGLLQLINIFDNKNLLDNIEEFSSYELFSKLTEIYKDIENK